MVTSIIISMSGVLLSTLGVVFLFYYGLSPYLKQQEHGQTMLHNRDALNNPNSKLNVKKKEYKKLSKFGLWLCIVGGTLQLIALSIQIFFSLN